MATRSRPITWTLVALLASNLLLGALAGQFIGAVDHHYRRLVATSLPLLNDVRALAWEVTVMQRSINRYPHKAPAERAELRARAETARRQAADLLARLRDRELPSDCRATVARLGQLQQELDALAGRWHQQVRAGNVVAAEQLNLGLLQPRYADYATVVAALAAQVEAHGHRQSRAYSADTSRFRAILLGIATWPLWLGALAGALALGLLVGLSPLLRRMDD